MVIPEGTVSTSKIAITLERATLEELDRLVAKGVFVNRSRAIQEAVQERLARLSRDRLARECAKLDPEFEVVLAEEGIGAEDGEWPEY